MLLRYLSTHTAAVLPLPTAQTLSLCSFRLEHVAADFADAVAREDDGVELRTSAIQIRR